MSELIVSYGGTELASVPEGRTVVLECKNLTMAAGNIRIEAIANWLEQNGSTINMFRAYGLTQNGTTLEVI